MVEQFFPFPADKFVSKRVSNVLSKSEDGPDEEPFDMGSEAMATDDGGNIISL